MVWQALICCPSSCLEPICAVGHGVAGSYFSSLLLLRAHLCSRPWCGWAVLLIHRRHEKEVDLQGIQHDCGEVVHVTVQACMHRHTHIRIRTHAHYNLLHLPPVAADSP